jgi:hypothetical protein
MPVLPKIYLETSAINFIYADDAPDKRDDTIILFNEIRAGKWDAYTSYTVINEISEAPEETSARLMALIKDFGIVVLPPNDEIHSLADIYVKEGIIPHKYRDDAVHIATACFYGMDIIISWNFKHIVKRKTILMTNFINTRENYRQISIHSPSEVIEYDE